MSEIKFTNLERALKALGGDIVGRYRKNLSKYNINASGNLSRNTTSIFVIKGDVYEVDLSLPDYWKYVENGRKPGKFPPIDKILEWIRIKPVLPRPMANGKLPTEKQLTFLISRKIALEGIQPRPVLKETLSYLDSKINRMISTALERDIENNDTKYLK